MNETTALPRLTFDDLPTRAQDAVRARYERLGYLGEIFSLVGNNESSLVGLLAFADSAGAGTDATHREILALSISSVNGALSEVYQHEHRSLKIGMTKRQVAAIERLDPADPDIDDDASVVLQLGVAVARGEWTTARSALNTAADRFGADVAVALLMQAGYYVMVNAVGHVLELSPPVSSIFDEPGA